jgi:hypothetical protein
MAKLFKIFAVAHEVVTFTELQPEKGEGLWLKQ